MSIKAGSFFVDPSNVKRTYRVVEVRAKGRGHTVVARMNDRAKTEIVESLTRFRKRVVG